MNKIKAALLIIIFTCFLGKAQSRYTCTCESQKGQFYSGENINACFHATEFVDTLLFPTKIKKEGSVSQLINTAYRFSKLLLINYRLSDYIMTMNHERFGHGYRALQAGGNIKGITYNPPPPFGNEFSFIRLEGLEDATNQERLLMTMGGSEAYGRVRHHAKKLLT